MKKEDMLFGGMLMAPFLFDMEQNNILGSSIIAIRFERDAKIESILEYVIKDAFLEVPPKANPEIELEFTKKCELKAFNKPKKWGEKPLIIFPLVSHGWSKKDYFLTIGIRDQAGNPLTLNITLLRHMFLKLTKDKLKFEIW